MEKPGPILSHVPIPQTFSVNDLPPSAHALLGHPCDPNACSCLPNAHVTCQWVQTATQYIPAKILNARKGDLILCAGDGSGSVGQLLGALAAPQVYTHMGVMVEDYTTIRHSTGIANRFQAYDVGNLFGTPEPTDGFVPDVVRFGWPGTMTQTVDEALQATIPGIAQPSPDPPPYLYCDRDNGTTSYPNEKIDNHCFAVNELSFNTVYGGQLGNERRDCLVVSPCSAAEIAHPVLRQILHSIADEVKGINGHYRFYAYTLAQIAQDPAWQGVGPLPVYRWDGSQNKWVRIESTVFDPSNPCAPAGQQAAVRATVPVVCSSLPWLAVQNFNARQNQFFVILDSLPPGERLDLPGCFRLVQPNPAGGLPLAAPDGLYNFAAADRAHAASVFHDGLKQEILSQMANAWDTKIAPVIATAENVPIAVLSAFAFIEAAVAYAGAAIATLAAILQITAIAAKALFSMFTDMPNHIANQICNTFAFDNAEDHTSNDWKNPGIGVAVGPDDIVWFWRATTQVTQEAGKTVVHGIYGQNRRLILQQPGWGKVPQCEWAFSQGPGEFLANVTLASNGLPVPGALIVVACNSGFTDKAGKLEMRLPAGTYWAMASWQDPQTDDFLTVSQVVTILFGGVSTNNFALNPPPVDFREIDTAVSGDAFEGSIWANGNPVDIMFSSLPIFLGPRGNPADPNDTSGLTGSAGDRQSYASDRTVGVAVSANLLDHGYVNGTITSTLNKPNGVMRSTTTNFGPIPPGQSESHAVHLTGDGLTPDEADLTITINNNPSYGPSM